MDAGLRAFDSCEDQPLCAVTFIWNYYQLLIGIETFSIYSNPRVQLKGKWFEHADPGFRNALCSLIGQKVVSATTDKKMVQLRFESDDKVEISLLPEDRIGDSQESLIVTDIHGGLTTD